MLLNYLLLLPYFNRFPHNTSPRIPEEASSNVTNRTRVLRQGASAVVGRPGYKPPRMFRPPGSAGREPLNIQFTATRSPYGSLGARLPPAAAGAESTQVLFNGYSTVVQTCFAERRRPCQRRYTQDRADCIRMGCCWNPASSISCGRSRYFVVSLKTGPDFSQCGIPDPQPSLVNPPFNNLLLGLLYPRIIGGTVSTLGEWPWTVLIYFRQLPLSNLASRVCGGSLISNKWIVTAAHCFQTPDASLYNVLLGANNLLSFSGNEVVREVQQLIISPNYVPSLFDFDVALIMLNETVNFTRFIRPICIVPSGTPTDSNLNPTFAGTTCTTVGWGLTSSPVGLVSNTLMQINVIIAPSVICHQVTAISNSTLYGGKPVALDGSSPKFCATGVNATTQDTCQGDSGGPLMCQHSDGRYYLHGLTSYGTAVCAVGLPAVYTQISNPTINSFITSNVNL